VAATLPAEDVLHGLVVPGMQAQDDGEWTWDMQEKEPDRLRAIESLTRSAYDLLMTPKKEK
jgi:hypothetical protein